MDNEINRIEKRAIEALAVVPVVSAVAERIGLKEALSLFREVNEREAYTRGKAVAMAQGRNDIGALAEEVEGWGRGGVWEMVVLEQTPTTFFFDVSKCPYYEKYAALGVREFGVCLSCCRDEPFARGFNPKLKLVRKITIMEGAERCDFRYYLANR